MFPEIQKKYYPPALYIKKIFWKKKIIKTVLETRVTKKMSKNTCSLPGIIYFENKPQERTAGTVICHPWRTKPSTRYVPARQ